MMAFRNTASPPTSLLFQRLSFCGITSSSRRARCFNSIALVFGTTTTMALSKIKSQRPLDLQSPLHSMTEATPARGIARYDAMDPSTNMDLLGFVLERDGSVVVENIISRDLAARIKAELNPYFNTDSSDRSGFFPITTQRATGLLGQSPGCVQLSMNKMYTDVANRMLSFQRTRTEMARSSTQSPASPSSPHQSDTMRRSIYEYLRP